MRPTARLLPVLLTVVAVLAPAAVANAATAWFQPAPVRWAPCDEDPGVDCATVRVPVDWSRPHGASIELALARRPATDPAARVGALVVNPGGPGGSGVDFVQWMAEFYFSEELLRRFDLIGFDPRGVARSHPVVCSQELVDAAPPLLITGQADFDRTVAYNRRLAADCRARTGPLFDHVDTLSVVRDLDAIRAAVGERQLTYYGVSYGTLIGQQYAERYPHRVRALALDSNMNHSLDTRGFLDTQTVAAQELFDEFVAWCDRTADCALHGTDVRARWTDLLTRADAGEIHDPVDPSRVLTAESIIGEAFSLSYGPRWHLLAARIAELETGAPTGTGADRGPGPLDIPRYTPADLRDADDTPLTEYPVFTLCQDWHLPVRDYRDYARHRERLAGLAPDMRFSPLALWGVTRCLGWPAGEVSNPQARLRVSPRLDLLLTGARYDPATPYRWSVEVARQLGPAAVLLTYEGWGHGAYERSDCAAAAIDAYLIAKQLPAPGTSCPAVEPEPAVAARTPAVPPVPVLPGLDVPGWSA